MKPPDQQIINDPDRLLAWLNDLWKYVELCSCKIATGSYLGDGATSKAITGVGFQPKYVKIWLDNATEGDAAIFEALDEATTAYAWAHIVTATHEHYQLDHRITSLDSDGFTVDDDSADAHPNKNGELYAYLALG